MGSHARLRDELAEARTQLAAQTQAAMGLLRDRALLEARLAQLTEQLDGAAARDAYLEFLYAQGRSGQAWALDRLERLLGF